MRIKFTCTTSKCIINCRAI